MGRQIVEEPLFHIFCLEDHVPAEHPLRRVDVLLGLGFVRDGTAGCMCRRRDQPMPASQAG